MKTSWLKNRVSAGTVLLLCLLWNGRPAHGEHNTTTPTIHLGFSKNLFSNINLSDAKASIGALSETLSENHRTKVNPQTEFFGHTEQMIEAMKSHQIDCMSALFSEYLAIMQEVKVDLPLVTTVDGGCTFEEYVLLVPREGGAQSLAELKGQSLMLHDNARTSLARDWMDRLLMQQDHTATTQTHFGRITRVPKLNNAVLPVFFNRENAALTTRAGFELMCEMNPQIRSKLQVLATSQPLIPAVTFFRGDCSPDTKGQLSEVLCALSQSQAGQQVLTIFRSKELVKADDHLMQATITFCNELDALRRTNPIKHSAGDTHE